MQATPPNPLSEPSTPRPLHAIDVDEAIQVWVAPIERGRDFAAALKEIRRRQPDGLALVVAWPGDLAAEELAGLLDLSTSCARRVVLTRASAAGPDLPPAQRELLGRRWPALVQYEPDTARAVIGTMLSLLAGDTLALLWPTSLGLADACFLVAQGERWRAAWESPEAGEFHRLPRTTHD